VDKDDFDKKFSLAKTLTNIRNSSNATTDSSNAQLLNSLLKTFNVDLKTNGFVKMDLQKRTQEATLSGLLDNMSPTAIFNRFDLSASNGQHCLQVIERHCALSLDKRIFLVATAHLFYSCILCLLISNNALVFNRGATGVDNDDFDKKFSLAKTLTK
jgi:hypothetical protein